MKKKEEKRSCRSLSSHHAKISPSSLPERAADQATAGTAARETEATASLSATPGASREEVEVFVDVDVDDRGGIGRVFLLFFFFLFSAKLCDQEGSQGKVFVCPV